MRVATEPQVLFRAAAGPRLGFGHLVRATVLRRSLGMPVRLSLRGSRQAARVARDLGWTLASGHADEALRPVQPALLVIDDPSAHRARPWRTAAARRGIPVASVHDLGLAHCGADLTIDGSVAHPGGAADGRALLGPRFLILDRSADCWREPRERSVLISLGGGTRSAAALRLAGRLRAARGDITVRIAGGMTARPARHLPAGVSWLGPRTSLGSALASSTIAVVGGGVTLYEACRVGTPAVGVAVVAAQRPTIAGLAERGGIADGGRLTDPDAAVRQAIGLLDDASQRARMSRLGRHLVDGHGAERVAVHLRRLVARHEARNRKDESL
jgi:spore coat polysaccharide biosynthesis predicted glycosyltransferase SpsG